jgi:hypothetical protein
MSCIKAVWDKYLLIFATPSNFMLTFTPSVPGMESSDSLFGKVHHQEIGVNWLNPLLGLYFASLVSLPI